MVVQPAVPGELRFVSSKLADSLGALLPGPQHTLLLQAALLHGNAALAAWTSWCRSVPDPTAALKREKRFVSRWLALLCDNLARNGVSVDKPLAPYLRGAVLHEELRAATCRTICHNLLTELAALPVVVLKDAALADTFYSRPGLRHVHDIELLVTAHDLRNAAALLESRGLVVNAAATDTTSCLEFRHPSGLPIALSRVVLRTPYEARADNGFWHRSRAARVADIPVSVPSAEDMLVHVLADAVSSANAGSLQWVCDACQIIARSSPLDWNGVLTLAEHNRLAPPLAVMLRYLATSLQAAIPDAVLRSFDAAATRTGRIGYELAWCALRSTGRETYRGLLGRCADWHGRAAVLRWMLVPSLEFLLSTHRLQRPALAPLFYLYRPVAYGARRAYSALRPPLRPRDPTADSASLTADEQA